MAYAAGRGAVMGCMQLGGCGDVACVVARGMVRWGSNSKKAQAQQKSVNEGIMHLKEPKTWLLAVE